ncbi:MAG TPA: hypothetical protein PK119_01945, partial [Candidatus Paceibacterota bacterium]|nr:hypothetical protein [Candidatus Paceibacterota bacterium]
SDVCLNIKISKLKITLTKRKSKIKIEIALSVIMKGCPLFFSVGQKKLMKFIILFYTKKLEIAILIFPFLTL